MASKTGSSLAAGDELVVGEQDAVPLEHAAGVREVDGRDLQLLPADVLPDVQLGPVGQREHPDVLAHADPGVVDVPQLGALVLRVPLAELVAEREHPLLGPGLLLVPAGAAEHRVEPVLLDRVEQGGGLQPVTAGPPAGLLGDPARRRSTPGPRPPPAARPPRRPGGPGTRSPR